MKSVIYERGQTVIPIKLRKELGLMPGTTLDWTLVSDGIRVVKMEVPKPRKKPSLLESLKALGEMPVAPRTTEMVSPPGFDAL
jgi:bifunctional DNA-binding transcriptional regulator/antitoxin component of YhaV-PrlF toxin-antitoxin module